MIDAQTLANVAVRYRVPPATVETWIEHGLLQQMGLDTKTIKMLTPEPEQPPVTAPSKSRKATPSAHLESDMRRKIFGYRDMSEIEKQIVAAAFDGTQLNGDQVFEILRRSNIIARED
jgi:hypothetical protein